MGPVRLMSRATGTLACLAAGLSGVESSSRPLCRRSVAAAADENAYSRMKTHERWLFYYGGADKHVGVAEAIIHSGGSRR